MEDQEGPPLLPALAAAAAAVDMELDRDNPRPHIAVPLLTTINIVANDLEGLTGEQVHTSGLDLTILRGCNFVRTMHPASLSDATSLVTCLNEMTQLAQLIVSLVDHDNWETEDEDRYYYYERIFVDDIRYDSDMEHDQGDEIQEWDAEIQNAEGRAIRSNITLRF